MITRKLGPEERDECFMALIRREVQFRRSFDYSGGEFYVSALRRRDLLEAAR